MQVLLSAQVLADCPSSKWHKVRPLGNGEVFLELKLTVQK
jgi:hypothetical protein